MAKQVILAVAGSGKTYYVCNNIDPNAKNLIIAYTHANIKNIKRELIKAYGEIPVLTTILTFDSFIYRYILSPYEPTILRFYGVENFKSTGITLKDPPPQRITNTKGDKIPNPYYFNKSDFRHYINFKNQYYCSNLSELIISVKENRISLPKKATKNMNKFFEYIFIDEFQDFREYDYDLVTAMSKELKYITLVGDYYQHSVSGGNNAGKPFKKGKTKISYVDFKMLLVHNGFDVDDTSLVASRRCPKPICDFIQVKLNINIIANNTHIGEVKWIDDNVDAILEDNSITKLVVKNASKYTFNAINWSYSKGDTLDNVCVILSEKLEKFDDGSFRSEVLPCVTFNQLYVALTRTKGNLYLVKYSKFKSVKEKYLKKKQ